MLRLSSCIRHGALSCGLSMLLWGAGCGSTVVPNAASESVGSASSSSGSGGAGGATNGASSSSGAGGDASTSAGAGGAPVTAGLPSWSKAFDNAYPFSVAVDPSGNIVVAGYFRGSLDFGDGTPLTSAGDLQAFVVKLDPSGKALWSKGFGNGADQWIRSLAVDSAGNVIIAGKFQSIIDLGGGPLVTIGPFPLGFLAKLDPSGNHLWSKVVDDSTGLEAFVAVDGPGNVLLTGGFHTSIDLGGGPLQGWTNQPSVFLAKLDPSGKHLWSKAFGGSVEVRSIAVDKQDKPVITGKFYGPVDFGGGVLPTMNISNAYVAQFDAMGGHFWSKGFSPEADSEGTCVRVDAGGALVLAGHFTGAIDLGLGKLAGSPGNKDIFVARLSTTGTFWSKGYGTIADDIPYGCALSAAGDVVFTGSFGAAPGKPQTPNGTIDFGGGPLVNKGDADMFAAKLNAFGSHVFSRSAGDVDQQYGTSVAVDGAGDSVVAGYFQGSINLGGTVLSSPEGMFLAKYGP